MQIGTTAKIKQATIRARVWRKSTQSWEDLGVISRFRDSLIKKIIRRIKQWLQYSPK
jgi:hypothetical protein